MICKAALRANKIDAWCSDEPILRYVVLENPDVALAEGMLDESSLAAVFPKTAEGLALRDQYSAFVDSLWADGTMEEIDRVWFSSDESRYSLPDYAAPPDTNGTLRLALDTSVLPFAFVKDGQIVGYDVGIAARFCEACGYRLEILPMNFEGVLPTLQTGKADFAACGITVTAERAESLLFSSPTYHSGTTMAVRKGPGAGRIRPAFEEAMQLLLPALDSPRVQAVCEYSEAGESAVWTIRCGGERRDPTAENGQLPLTVLKGMMASLDYAWEEGEALPNRLRLVVKEA